MAYCSSKKWTAFSSGVQELRWTLLIWLEGLLAKEVTCYEGSDSVIYEPDNWSKYKLVPYDARSMPPLAGLNEGILVCIDAETYEESPIVDTFPHILLRPEQLVYRVNRQRTYRVVDFPIMEDSKERRARLFTLAELIRSLENAPASDV